MSKKIKFKCPGCGCIELEECRMNTIQYSVVSCIEDVDGEDIVDYDANAISYDEGDVSYYNCSCCSYIIVDENNHAITYQEDLCAWLKENCDQNDYPKYDCNGMPNG
jgi:hypothetical protein